MTAIIGNWLKATADDAMGMEPGDRHMANEARKLLEAKDAEIERLQASLTYNIGALSKADATLAKLQAEIERLVALRKEDGEDMQRLSDQVDYLSDESAKLQAVVDAAKTIPYVQGIPGIAETHEALAALEGQATSPAT